MGELLRRTGNAIQVDEDGAHWWTFAGGRINHTTKYALEWIGDWKVIGDNFQLRIEGDGVNHTTVDAAIQRMNEPGFWDDPATHRAIMSRLPEYRLSKFQRVLPEAASIETVGRYLLDVQATQRWLQMR
jgi:ATP-dependent Lhr-like helicase